MAGALFCLSPYAQAHCSLGENRMLLEMLAAQIRQLGLHNSETIKLYSTGEASVFSVFRYMDT